jgi:hypothetical protein
MALTSEKASELGKKSFRKGVPNKTTVEIREAFQMLIEDNLDNLNIWLEQLADKNPEKAIDVIIKLSEFVVPKLNRSQIDFDIGKNEIEPITGMQITN